MPPALPCFAPCGTCFMLEKPDRRQEGGKKWWAQNPKKKQPR